MPPLGCYHSHLKVGPLEGQGGFLSRCPFDGVHQKYAAEDEGGDGAQCTGILDSTSLAIGPKSPAL